MSLFRAKENIHLAQPPELATVTEDEEGTPETAPAPVAVTPRTVVEKDEHGKTQLHHLVRRTSLSTVGPYQRLSGTVVL